MRSPYIQAISSSLYDLSGIDVYSPETLEDGMINLPDLVYPSPSSSPSSLSASPRTPPMVIPEQPQLESPEEQGHIPRPRNAFIIFRSQFASNYRARTSQTHPHQNLVSRDAAEAWNKLSADEKLPYKLQADEEKREHRKKYPNYTYMPGCRTTKRGASANAKRSNKPYSPPLKKNKASKGRPVRASDASPCTTAVSTPSPVMGYISMEEMLANYTQIDAMYGGPFDRIDPQFGFRPELTYTALPPLPKHFVAPTDNVITSPSPSDGLLNSGSSGVDAFSSTLFDMLYHIPIFESEVLSDSASDQVTAFYDNGYQNLFHL